MLSSSRSSLGGGAVRTGGGGAPRTNRVELFRNINEVVSELRSINEVVSELNSDPKNVLGKAIESKFPQVFVFGNQSCGKSKLLNAMIQLDLFPSNATQCTVRPTFFIREFCNCANIEAKVEYKVTESGKVQQALPRVFNLDLEGQISSLEDFIMNLQSVALVLDILRASSCSSQSLSTSEHTFKLSNWYDTAIHIVLKVPLSKSEGKSQFEFLQFVDLPGLQAVNPKMGTTLEYNELVIPQEIVKSIIESNSVEHQAWFTAPWFTFLTLQFLKKPSALGIHCISSQTALPGNVRSVNIVNRLKAQNLLQSTTVEVWTMADFHCPKLTPPHPWVNHFRTRQHDLFQNIWTSSFFVGAFMTKSSSGRGYPLTYKCLSNGMGEITKQELIDEGSQIVELFAEVDEEHGILKRLGPFSLLQKCVAFIDDNFNEKYVRTVAADCHVTIRDLQAFNKQQAEVYPISKHGDRDPQVLHLWVKRVVNSSLVWMCTGNRDLPEVGTLAVHNGINWRAKVAAFQQSNLRHCLSRDLRPEFLRNASVHFCEQIDFVTGTFPNWTLSDGLIQSEVKTFRSVSNSDYEDTCKTPLDHIWGSMRLNNKAGNRFQNAVSIESSAHNTVRKMLARLTKDNSDGELGIFCPSKDVRDHICDEWWYSFKNSVNSLFDQICGSLIKNVSEHMISGELYFPTDKQFPEEPLFANASYKTLYGIFQKKLRETLKEEWQEALKTEYEKIARVSLPDNAGQLTSNQEVLSRLCCTDSNLKDDTVSFRFEQVIEAITGILSSWEEVQSASEETRAPVSEVVTITDNSAPRVDLPNFTALCNSKHYGTKSSGDILESFGAQIAAAPISGGSIVNSMRDHIQGLLDVTASSDSKRSTWEPVPRLAELHKQLSVPVQRFDAGSAVQGTRAVVPLIRIAVQDPKYHYIIPSDHYTDVSLRWCLKVSYENWPIQKPPRVIFRSLHDFESLWSEMKNLGSIDCNSDSLPRNTAFLGSHRYHHLEFIRDSRGKLQTALTNICDTVARMSSEACKQSLEKWLEFNHSQELYSDSEILKHKQAQFSESSLAFWKEVQSCSFQNARLALHELQQSVSTEAILFPFAETVGQVEALKTRIGSRKTLSQVRDQDVFDHYSVMKTLQNWRQHDRSAYANFMRGMRSTLYNEQTEQHVNPTRRDFKLEAQCIASIELAQSFMQSTCFRLYSVSFAVLENQLGNSVVATILNVREKMFEKFREIQGDIDAKNFRRVLDQHPTLACPVEIENTMRIAAESVEKLRRIISSINY
jgi:hypothetical protein